MARTDLPLGTVTFLFTDIEGSTRLLQDLGDRFALILERHNEIVLTAAGGRGGVTVKNEGDGFFLAFQSAIDAAACAVDIQRGLAAEPWVAPRPVAVRIGAHTGEGRLGGSDYVGMDVHRAARIGACGHGGQIVISESTARLTEYALPEGTHLEDLGSHRLKDLANEEHLYQLTIDGLPNEFPPVRTLSALKGNLPHRDLAFIGRLREREQVVRALESSRLVTLTGPGGVGKTSLALNVAEEISPAYPDGVWLVEVSRITDESLLAPSVAGQLRITESPGEPLVDTLATRLARARTLLVLDGCEHLIDAVAKLTDALLHSTSDLHVLVTSREWLSIRGEHLVQLSPLAIPGPGVRRTSDVATFDSVALFVSRARLVQPGFDLDDANAALVAEICRRLDGIPLAIELAAARLKVLSVWQLVDRLDQQFALLASRTRDIPPHQQTLQTTLDWSYDILTRHEQTLFGRLAVFSGGFTLDAVEQICSGGVVVREHVLDLLGRLVETSLVMATESDLVRYRLLEPIAHYARMRLEESEDVDDLEERHARFYVDYAEDIGDRLLGRDQVEWSARLDVERYNLRSALGWLYDHERAEDALRLAGALRWLWVIERDTSEGPDWLERTLERRQGVAPAVVARALNGVGLLAIRRLDFDRASSALNEALEICRKLGDERGVARQVYHLATLAWFRDDYDEAQRLASQAEEMSRECEDEWGLAWTLAVLGTMARLRGDLPSAARFMRESHQIFVRHAGLLDLGWSHLRMGALARDQGDYRGASEAYSAGRDMLLKAGDVLGLAHADAGLGALAWLAGDEDHAIELYRSVLEGFSLSEEASNNMFELKTMIQGSPSSIELQQIVQWNRERAEQTEGHVGAKAALAEYLYHMGKTAHRNGEHDRARHALVQSLRLGNEADDARGFAIAAAALAVIDGESGRERRAAMLFGLADHVADEPGVPWPPPDEPGYEAAAAAVRSALGDTAFAEAAGNGATMSRTDAVALASESD